jgi:hypothetical protein
MSKCLRTLRFAFLTATLLFLSFAPTRAQQIQLEVANAVAIRNVVGDPAARKLSENATRLEVSVVEEKR